MRNTWIGLLTGVLLLVFSSFSSAQDALRLDLEEYIQVNQVASVEFNQFMDNFQKKASLAGTPEEFSQIIAELQVALLDTQRQYKVLEPKSNEMKPLVKKVNSSIALMIEAVNDLDRAVIAQDQDLLGKVLDKMNKSTTDLENAEIAIEKLANENGVGPLSWPQPKK